MTQITSPESKAWLAMKSRLDQWTETAIMDPDEKLFPTANQAFLIVQQVGLDTDIVALQYGCGDEFRGVLNVSVMAPLGWTYAQHSGLASRLCEFFPAGAKYTYSDATVTIYARTRQQGATRLDQSWNRLEVQVPWRIWG